MIYRWRAHWSSQLFSRSQTLRWWLISQFWNNDSYTNITHTCAHYHFVTTEYTHLYFLNSIMTLNKQSARAISWWRHQMETFSALLAFCAGNSPVIGEFPAQRPVTPSFEIFLICAWINSWVNNREAGDLRRHRAHDVSAMSNQHLITHGVLSMTSSWTVHCNSRSNCRLIFSPCSIRTNVYLRKSRFIDSFRTCVTLIWESPHKEQTMRSFDKLVNPKKLFYNRVAVDLKRHGISHDNEIDIVNERQTIYYNA